MDFTLPICLVKMLQKRAMLEIVSWNVAKLMVESNKKRIVTNLDNVIKNFPSDREVVVFSKKYNDLSDCRVDLN